MKFLKGVFVCVLMAIFLVACGGNDEPLEEKSYQNFKDTITKSDFTGFAYILSDYKAQEDDYMSAIKDVFEKEGKTLIYFNDQTSSDKVHEQFNEDSKKKDLYLPKDEIAYRGNVRKMRIYNVKDFKR